MGYIPKFIHFKKEVSTDYPFGVNWDYNYITQGAKTIFNLYRKDIENKVPIALVAMGTSGAMIAGAILTELYNIIPYANIVILIVRKDKEEAHSTSLFGINTLNEPKFIVVDDFISSGETIKAILKKLDSYFNLLGNPVKYDALCIGNTASPEAMKKNYTKNYKLWKEIYSRFKYVICNPISNKTIYKRCL